jgi:hypothetical protein
MATKIILPASQIIYTEIHAPGPSRDEKRRQIAAGLEGRTPYAVEDLVFDWSGKGSTVKVAVVARETLEEAEGFAVSHRLNPVSFVAIPEEGTFVGEAWFGPAAAAASVLAEGETVERDREAVVILQREAGPADAAAAPVEPEPAVAEVEPAATAANDDLPGLEEALNGSLPASGTLPVPVAEQAAVTEPAAVLQADTPSSATEVEPARAKVEDDLEASLSAALADTPARVEDAPALAAADTDHACNLGAPDAV